MKRCPQCRRDYYDETLLYCLDDGTALLDGPGSGEESRTRILGHAGDLSDVPVAKRPTAVTTSLSGEFPATSGAEFILGRIRSNRGLAALVFTIVAVAGLAAVYGAYRFFGGDRRTAAPTAMKVTRLTSSGKVRQATISGDGRYAVHVVEEPAGQGLWIRQIATTSDINIVPAAAATQYLGAVFSSDGNYVYYARREAAGARGALFQVPTLGGSPKKVLEGVAGQFTLSPDGKQAAFHRRDESKGSSSLILANLDGSSERMIATRTEPMGFEEALAWSPDGLRIACAAYENTSLDAVRVVTFSVGDGSARAVSPTGFGSINSIAWIHDGSGLMISAAHKSSGYFFQIWHVPSDGTEMRRVTNDLMSYSDLSLTANSKTALTVQGDFVSNLWVAPYADPSKVKKISSGKYDGGMGVSWTPDGRIVSSNRDWDLYIMNADGTSQRLLTGDEHNNRWASVSPDGRYIVFESWRPARDDATLWRTDIDGSNPVQLIKNGWASSPRVSPDGQWVVYESNVSGPWAVWKTSADGRGEPVKLTDIVAEEPGISPDGKLIACFYYPEGQPAKIAVIPFEGGPPVHVLDVDKNVRDKTPVWTPDGKAIIYGVTTGGVSNLFAQPLAGGPPKQLTNFQENWIFAFDVSRDGKQLLLSRGDVSNDAVLISGF